MFSLVVWLVSIFFIAWMHAALDDTDTILYFEFKLVRAKTEYLKREQKKEIERDLVADKTEASFSKYVVIVNEMCGYFNFEDSRKDLETRWWQKFDLKT